MKSMESSIDTEIDMLNLIEKYTKSINHQIYDLYTQKFPKECKNCGRYFKSREDYEDATRPTNENQKLQEMAGKVLEYRNCVCGSTLLLSFADRRDKSDFGLLRRKLFTTCVNRICNDMELGEEDVIPAVRQIFRNCIEKMGKSDYQTSA